MYTHITVRGARLHNLKNITLSIPKNQLVVFTGLSGSGKSSLAFDTLHREGQRQYMESLGLVTHEIKAPVDSIEGLSPSISVDQHLTNRSPRSTVGTVTEVYTYLRVLFARAGTRPCPACGVLAPPSYEPDANGIDEESSGSEPASMPEAMVTFPCPSCGAALEEIGMAHFSFNKPEGACPTCTGLGMVFQPHLEKLVDFSKTIMEGAVTGWDIHYNTRNIQTLLNAASFYGFRYDPSLPVGEYEQIPHDLLLYGVDSAQFRRHFPEVEPPNTVARGRFEGVVTNLMRRYAEHIQDAGYREKVEEYLLRQTCPDCAGTRLRPESRLVEVDGMSIVEVSRLPLTRLAAWLEQLPERITAQQQQIALPVLEDLRERVRRLMDVGVGYLTLERATPSLSAGEAQRLRLAALLGSGLSGVLYVLDEPTIGLHPRDTRRLIQVLYRLRSLGNTVLVIEHDLDVLRAADFIVDIGPGAGRHGGEVVAAGTPQEVQDNPASLTGAYLARRKGSPEPRPRRTGSGKLLTIRGAREHNLKNITVSLPLGVLTAVSGPSGSGKSSLMLDILDRAARQRFYGAAEKAGLHESIEGWEHIDKIITIDQTPIGRIPRSNAATYTDVFTPIRQVFAGTQAARLSGLEARHFSFNVPGGRCDRCEGAGVLSIHMQLMPDIQVTCPACRGKRFKREVLAVEYHGLSIAQVLDLTIEEALPVFAQVPAAASRLKILADVGLGYLKLGQPATTLSGGEAQRVKLAKELSRRSTGRTLYLLDEPTTGLHPDDVSRLLMVLQRLVDGGNTVVVIEHNLDVIRQADWIIDLGPEGGEAGGELVAEGTPEEAARNARSETGKYLGELLQMGEESPTPSGPA
jgi:excinuclease ABC subunit A